MRTSLALVLLTLTACGEPLTTVRLDAGPDAPGPDRCDPHRAPCRVILHCTGVGECESVDLSNGTVGPDGSTRTRDVQSYLGRYLTLSSSTAFCRFGADPSGTGSTAFASLSDIPTDPAACSWAEGSNLLCGVNTSSYTPSCSGYGVLVRDASGQLHRLRILEDRAAASGFELELEWVAIDG